jgi:hypothetical protein
MSVPIRTSQTLHDPVRRAHRRVVLFRFVFGTLLCLLVVGCIGWGGWYLWSHRTSESPVTAERTPTGIWCKGKECTYFDRSGQRWGSAIFSRGPLLLLVEDERANDIGTDRLMAGLFAAVDVLPDAGLRALSVVFPNTAPGDMRIETERHFELMMDAFGDIPDQLLTLSVFLADRAKDPSWAPEYIDLRTPGRVYYK